MAEQEPQSQDASIKGIEAVDCDGTGLKIGICKARWNKQVIDALFDGAKEAILKTGVLESDIHVIEVPGSFELPLAAKKLIKAVDAVICLGCLIKGETMHFEYICGPVSQACMTLGQEEGKPCIFGVLCCLTEQQALARAGLTPDGHNHGTDWGSAAVQMAAMMRAPIPGLTSNKRGNNRQRRRQGNQRREEGKPNQSANNNGGRKGGRRRDGRRENNKKEDVTASKDVSDPAPAPASEATPAPGII